jgi:hypothetical protein
MGVFAQVVTNIALASVRTNDKSAIPTSMGREFANHYTMNHNATEYAISAANTAGAAWTD